MEILEAIRTRRSVRRYKATPIGDTLASAPVWQDRDLAVLAASGRIYTFRWDDEPSQIN